MQVTRYGKINDDLNTVTGDYLRVGNFDLGEFRDISEAEHRRATRENPKNPALSMRPMFYTGGPYWREILELAREARG